MTLLVPPEMQNLMNRLLAAIPGSENGGIAAAKPGYHNSREDLPASDYSVGEYSDDRLGDPRYASAFDLTMRNTGTMTTVTQRMLNAWLAQDSRLDHVRAFNGTVDGVNAYRWDVSNGAPSVKYPTDDTHLWHIHVEVFRRWSNDKATMDAIYSVLAGVGDEDVVNQADIDNIVKQVTENVTTAIIAGFWRDGFTSLTFDQAWKAGTSPTLTDLSKQIKSLPAGSGGGTGSCSCNCPSAAEIALEISKRLQT